MDMKLNIKKHHYNYIFIGIIIFLFAFFFNKELLSYSICKQTISEPVVQYTTGNIIVVFKNEVPAKDAVSTISSYGLQPELFTKWDSFLDVKVPDGDEKEWICKLSSNQNIKHAIYKISIT